jgi:HPt (histidine-containing phosphotransfer) domain-containing protein
LPAEPQPQPQPQPQPETDNAMDAIALDDAARIWRDLDVYRRFLAKFARDNTGSMEQLRLLLEQGNAKLAGALLHKLKGSAGNLALPELTRVAGRLEHRLMQGADVLAELEPLQEAFARACRAIAAYTAEAGGGEPAAAPRPPADQARAKALLAELLAALDRDNPDLATPVLQQLDGLLPAARLAPIGASVDDFDFRRAEQLARELAAELNEQME